MAKKRRDENTAAEEERKDAPFADGDTVNEEPKKPKEKKKKEKKEKKPRTPPSPDAVIHQILPIVFVALAALLGVCIYTAMDVGALGAFLSSLFGGLFGKGAYVIPVWILLSAILWRTDIRADAVGKRQSFGLALIVVASVLAYTFGMPEAYASALGDFYRLGGEGVGGGVIGGLLGYTLDFAVSTVGTVIVCAAILLVFFFLGYGRAFRDLLARLFGALKGSFARMRERRLRMEDERATSDAQRRASRIRDEETFYDLTPAVRTDGAQIPTGGAGAPQRDPERRITRTLYDADAEEPFGQGDTEGARPPVPATPSFDPNPPTASTYAPTPSRTPLPSRSFFDAEDLSSAPPVEEGSEHEAKSSTGTPDEGVSFRLVGSAPIPPNRATPFEKKAAEPRLDEGDAEAPVERTPVEAIPTPAPAPVPTPDPVPTPEPVPAPTPEPDPAPVAAPVAEAEEEDAALVINDGHVVKHAGLESFATEEEINKYAEETGFYSFPPLSLLHEDNTSDQVDSNYELEIKRQKLIDTLKEFGINVTIKVATRGPRLTRYELVPEPGTRISKIENLVDEITMNLEAISVRIEAPIPGKAAIGVEVPNVNVSTVRLRGLLDTDTFRDAEGKTTVCLGVDVVGKPMFADLGKMPHLLVAGATGMGKSVCINTILVSLLYKAHPDDVKLILIDPKKVEFQSYANIPHLLVPVVTEPQKAAGSLAWAVGEMERRYDLIESAAVRNIAAYNKTVDDHPGRSRLPHIVIVIDELHDLMLQARDAVEDSIARIAAKARAAGIILIIGTQRPSVNVITGVIKANIPSRIAFHVASQVDSRTILDAVGAEKLLNNGDMLFMSPGMKMLTPTRVQGAFLDDDEVNRVADYLRKNSSAVRYDESVMADMERESEKYNKDKRQGGDFGSDEDMGGGSEDDLFYKAVEVAFESGKISTSLLQRRLSVGFGKASRMIDRMQEMGIVSKPNGQKPRDILISLEEYREMRLRNDE